MSENATFTPDGSPPRVVTESEFDVWHSSGAALTLTATHVVGDVIDVREARELVLLVDVNAGAASNTVELIPHFSLQGTEPTSSDDAWFVPAVQDGSVTAELPALTRHSGAAYSLVPEWGTQVYHPLKIELPESDNDSDEMRVMIVLNVERARWFMLSAACAGAGTLDDLLVKGARVL